jgi:hypothetical protein
MSTLSEYLLTKTQINDIYSILIVSHPTIEEQYGAITLVKVILNNKEDKPLVIIPGYSDKSFMSGFDKLMDGFDSYKNKYSVMYAVCWGPTVKTVTDEYSKSAGDNKEEQYKLNEEIRIKLAIVLDKILRSPDLELTNITLFGKSAGGGVSIHIASMNPEVKYLYISCPGTNNYGEALKHQKKLPIKLAWNEDDDKLEYTDSQKFIKVFEKNKNNFNFYSYETGGHEFNPLFIQEL